MQWFAGSFTTGANADGYALDHVDIAFTGVATDATFAISLWSDASDTPQANLGAFSHDTGIRFNPTDNLSVLPSTTYWLVLESNQISDLGSNYAWRTTEDSSFAVSGGWSVAGSFAQSTNQGATWAASPTDYLYAVTATPASAVPEPSTTAVILAGFALVGVVCTRRRARAKGVA
ncbi:choice-of-anchor R domain-containing protein [Synoicihabitans lomoniglobus]